MTIQVNREEYDLLQAVANADRENRPLKDVAAELGVTPPAITYRLARLGYSTRQEIVDIRSGKRLVDLMASGAVVCSEPADAETSLR